MAPCVWVGGTEAKIKTITKTQFLFISKTMKGMEPASIRSLDSSNHRQENISQWNFLKLCMIKMDRAQNFISLYQI